MKKINPIGETFHRLTVISEEPSVNYRRFFICQCSCGQVTKVSMSHLKTGHTQSCGCIFKENPPRLRHGHNRVGKRTSLYHVWDQMLSRCQNPNSTSYIKYGAKGVTVHPSWQDSGSFIEWALQNGYLPGLTIDRQDTYGNYEPSNCRWIPMTTQGINKRISKKNTSGFSGVSPKRGRWTARITVDGLRKDLGYYSSAEEANSARLSYIKENNLMEHLNAYTNQQR